MRANNSDHNSSFSWLYEINININGTGDEKKKSQQTTTTTTNTHYITGKLFECRLKAMLFVCLEWQGSAQLAHTSTVPIDYILQSNV